MLSNGQEVQRQDEQKSVQNTMVPIAPVVGAFRVFGVVDIVVRNDQRLFKLLRVAGCPVTYQSMSVTHTLQHVNKYSWNSTDKKTNSLKFFCIKHLSTKKKTALDLNLLKTHCSNNA